MDASDRRTFEEIAYLLAGLILLGAIAQALFAFIENFDTTWIGEHWATIRNYFLAHIWPFWKAAAVVLGGLSIYGIFYSNHKLTLINLAEKPIFNPGPEILITDEESAEEKNKRWEKIVEFSSSTNSSDWRLAIIEADVMLEETLHAAGYVGDSVGDMLKSVERGDFATIEDAWEAHKTRNRVAHSGGSYELNQRETKRIIALFENVFREFEVI